MRRLTEIVFSAMLCTVFFSGTGYPKEPVYIGLSAPMSGQYSAYGKDFKKAIDLAVDHLNNEGGINGQAVEIIVEDSQGTPKISKRIARKFTADQRIVAEIGDFTSSSSMAAAPIYRKAGMVQFSPTASHPSFAPGSPFSFSIAGTQAAGEGPFMAQHAISTLKKKRLSVLYINNDWGIASKKYFIEEAQRLGATIVAVESYLEGTSDFEAVLAKIRKSQPDLLYICSMYEDGALISRQRLKLGWDDVIIMGAGPLYSIQFLENAGKAAENVFAGTAFFPNSPLPEVQQFVKSYEARYNLVPNLFAAYAYDAMSILAEAIKKAGADRRAIRDELAKTSNFPGATGAITFTKHGDVVKKRVLVQVKNGDFVLYSIEPVFIGLTAPMTGQYASYGDSFKKAIDLALDQINKEGVINGRPIELIVEDSQGIPKFAKRIARKFTTDKRIVAEIGDFTSSCSLAAQAFYQKAGMVQLSPTASHPSFAPGSPFSFSVAGTQAGVGPFMAEVAVTVLNKKNIAVLHVNNDWGMASKKFFIEEAERLGATIVAVESYLDGTTDFVAPLKRLHSLQPELLYICSMVKDGAVICKQRQELGWEEVTVAGPDSFYSKKFIELGGEAVENVYTASAFFPNNPRPSVQQFVKAYEKLYNQTPTLYAADAFDAMNILAKAIEKVGTDRQAIRDELAKTSNFSGATGTITFSQHGDVAKERVVLQVENSEFVLYGK